MNQDITIIYQGASGGFLLFYYLLLTGNYCSGIKTNLTVPELIKNQFSIDLISDRANWKKCEYWPDNAWAKQHQSSPRLFLICNPFFNSEVHKGNMQTAQGTYKILLYTDLRLQIRLAWEKHAWWFTSTSRQKLQQGSEYNYIRWILSQGEYDPALSHIRQQYKPDLEIRLEDFVTHPVLPGFQKPSNSQLQFVKYWLSLQSSKSQKLLQRIGGP